MPAEKGIFLDVLPRFDMAAMGAILSKVEQMFAKSGAAIGTTFGAEAEAKIARLAEAERKSANVTEDAELRKTRAIHATEIAEQQASVATDRRILAQTRLNDLEATGVASENALAAAKVRVEAATVAETRAAYAATDAALAQTARTRDLAAATALSAKAHDAHSEALAASAATASNAGRAFGLVGGIATGTLVVGLAEATKHAADFQTAMTKLTASAGETQQNVQGISDGILKLAGTVGVSATSLADSMFLVEKAGYHGGDGLKVLTAASQLANAEGADLNDTVNGLTTTMRDFGFGVDQAATVASKMNVAAGDSKAPLQQFSSALHNVEPVAAIAKIKIDEVYAAMARITQSGAGADQASEWLNNTITHLTNMNDQQTKFVEQIGLSAPGLKQDLANPMIGMTGVINEITDKIKGSLNPAQQLVLNTQFQSVTAVKALNDEYAQLTPKGKELADQIKAGTLSASQLKELRLSKETEPMLRNWDQLFQKVAGFNDQLKKGQGDLLSVSAAFAKAFGTDSGLKVASLLAGTPEQVKAMKDEVEKLQHTTAEADGTVKGFNETQATLNAKLKDAKAGFGAAVVELGNAFIPAMTHAANVMKDVAEILAQHPALMYAIVAALGAVSAAWVGLKTVAVVGGIVEGLGTVVTKLGLVKTASLEANAAMEAMGPAAAKGEVGVAAATTAEKAELASVTAVGSGVIATLAAIAGPLLALNWMNDDYNKNHPNQSKSVRSRVGALATADRSGPVGPSTGPHGGKGDQLRGQRAAAGGGAGNVDPLAALNALGTPDGSQPSTLDLSGGGGAAGATGSGSATGAPPVGTRNDPIYIDPQSVTDGLNDSDMGASGTVGGTLMDIFQKSVGDGGFSLKNIASLMTTFVANLALGNPAGKLAAGVGLGGDDSGDMVADATAIENMSPTERIEKENTIKLQKSIRAYKKALREYAKAVQKYGPGSEQALNAEDAALNARDAIDQVQINQQQAGASAVQAFADDQSRGIAATNPGKYARDQAAAGAYSSGGGGANSMSQDQVASAIIREGQKRGLSRDQIVAGLNVAKLESNLGANPASRGQQNQGGTIVQGIFQQDLGYSGDHNDPTNAAGQFFDRLVQRAQPGDSAGQAAVRVQQGTYGSGYVDSQGQGATYDRLVGQTQADANNAAAKANAIPWWLLGHGGGQGPMFRQSGGGAPGNIGPFPVPPGVAPYAAGMTGASLGAPTVGGGTGSWGTVNGVHPGASVASGPASPGVQSSQPKGGSGKGAGASGGGLLGGALGAGAMAANAFAPGAGAGVQIAAEEAERAAGYVGQVGGILAQGVLETFMLHGDNGAGGNGGWIGKIAGGIAGAHPSIPNAAGTAQGLDPKAKQTAPPLSPDQHGQGTVNGTKPGPDQGSNNNTINIENQNINHGDGGAQNRDAMRQLIAFPGM
jgi:TP901 family phage tail tape measure protein